MILLIIVVDTIKSIACTYMQNYIKSTLKSYQVSNDELNYIAETLVKLLLPKQVSTKVKPHLQISLENILFIDTSRG